MTWTPPAPPEWVERLNAHGPAAGGAEYLVSLDPDDLLDAARRSTGLSDFGGDTWRPHFEVLVRALDAEADLTMAGRVVARTELLRALRQRLRHAGLRMYRRTARLELPERARGLRW